MAAEIETFTFEADGDIPNNQLPLVFYRQGLVAEARTPSACAALFAERDWGGNWAAGVFDYWHYHVTGHEVLGCVAGEAEIGFGGDHGIKVTVGVGDAVVIPAGVGHKRLSTGRAGFTVVGGYPSGQNGAIARPGDFEIVEAKLLIDGLALPAHDPVHGLAGPLMEAWGIP